MIPRARIKNTRHARQNFNPEGFRVISTFPQFDAIQRLVSDNDVGHECTECVVVLGGRGQIKRGIQLVCGEGAQTNGQNLPRMTLDHPNLAATGFTSRVPP